jgi:predicted nucleotidyltransferase
MEKAIRDEADKLAKIMANTVPAEKIYLFGSYAYGTPHKDSDLDFYVVLKPGVQMRPIETGVKIRTAICDTVTMPIDIVSHPHEVFYERARQPSLEKTVVQKGVLLYEGGRS